MAFWNEGQRIIQQMSNSKIGTFWKMYGQFVYKPIVAAGDIAISEDPIPPLFANIADIGTAFLLRKRRGVLPFLLPGLAYLVGRGIGYKAIRREFWGEKRNVGSWQPYAGKTEAEVEFNVFAQALRQYGTKAGTAHRRITIPKDILTKEEVKQLGFLPTALAIPESGQKSIYSYRNPENLFHIHEYDKYWTMHKDRYASLTMSYKSLPSNKSPLDYIARTAAGLSHIFMEGVPGLYYWTKGFVSGRGSMVERVQQGTNLAYTQVVERLRILERQTPMANQQNNVMPYLFGIKGHDEGHWGRERSFRDSDFEPGSSWKGLFRSVSKIFTKGSKVAWGRIESIVEPLVGKSLASKTAEEFVRRSGTTLVKGTSKYFTEKYVNPLSGRTILSETGTTIPMIAAPELLARRGIDINKYATQYRGTAVHEILESYHGLAVNEKFLTKYGHFHADVLRGQGLFFAKTGVSLKELKYMYEDIPGFRYMKQGWLHGSNKAVNAIKAHDVGCWGREITSKIGDFKPGESWKGLFEAISRWLTNRGTHKAVSYISATEQAIVKSFGIFKSVEAKEAFLFKKLGEISTPEAIKQSIIEADKYYATKGILGDVLPRGVKTGHNTPEEIAEYLRKVRSEPGWEKTVIRKPKLDIPAGANLNTAETLIGEGTVNIKIPNKADLDAAGAVRRQAKLRIVQEDVQASPFVLNNKRRMSHGIDRTKK